VAATGVASAPVELARLRELHAPGIAAAAVTALILAVAGARLLANGWHSVGADDARYLYVGLSVLDGRGAFSEIGELYLWRAPAYGVVLALGARLLDTSDPTLGAHVVAWMLSLAALVAVLRIAWLLEGLRGTLAAAVALLATPLIWDLLPKMRVDPVQAAGLLGTILLLWRPTSRRWLLAGALLGLTILAKESVLLALALPLAWLGALDWRRWSRMTGLFALAAAAVAGWWWLWVWYHERTIFPLNALGIAIERPDTRTYSDDPFGLVLGTVFVAGWALLMAGHARHPGARLLALAALALVPPTVFAAANLLSARNFVGLALLSCAAVGGGVPVAARWVGQRLDRIPQAVRRLVAVALAVLLAAALVGQGQGSVPGVTPPPSDELAADWLVPRVQPRDRVISTFRGRSYLGARLYGHASVATIPTASLSLDREPADFVWLAARGDQLVGVTRYSWGRAMGRERARFVVVSEPHPLSLAELVPYLDRAGESQTGLRLVKTLAMAGSTTRIYSVDPGKATAIAQSMPLHASADALASWIEQGDQAVRVAGLLALEVVVVDGQPDLARLDALIAPDGCLARTRESGPRAYRIVQRSAVPADCAMLLPA
jgi:hypothetical protein